jgi:hypothetical protein
MEQEKALQKAVQHNKQQYKHYEQQYKHYKQKQSQNLM